MESGNKHQQKKLFIDCFAYIIISLLPVIFSMNTVYFRVQVSIGVTLCIVSLILQPRHCIKTAKIATPIINSLRCSLTGILCSFIIVTIIIWNHSSSRHLYLINITTLLATLIYLITSRAYYYKNEYLENDSWKYQLIEKNARKDGQASSPSLPKEYCGKRFFDIIVTTNLIIVTSPIFILIYVSLFILQKQSPFFKQIRIGKNNAHFEIYKFRTLSDIGSYLTLGKVLRYFNLDELPQLYNILKGEMSIVGPRPELLSKAKCFSVHDNLRHSVKPGITGPWQLSPFRSLDIKHHLEYDFHYIYTNSLLTDIIIIILTPIYMLNNNK